MPIETQEPQLVLDTIAGMIAASLARCDLLIVYGLTVYGSREITRKTPVLW